MMKKLFVLGIRGLPANHGGFETFAEHLCKYLVGRGWDITVYCQEYGHGKPYESDWHGIKRVHIPVASEGSAGSMLFDLKSIWHARKSSGVHLTLGYNTALFNVIQRLYGIVNVINMDGIEWRRKKWGPVFKAWFWMNERFGCWLGNHLIADHPEIKKHLARVVSPDKISMIPYGAPLVLDADIELIKRYDLESQGYVILIARPEPENSILEIVAAFSAKKRNIKLVVLGHYDWDDNLYHREVFVNAGDEVVFLGAIYDEAIVSALRFHAYFYIHGHQVGGTNPSLVEALGAGNAVLAHDNIYNRWVAGDAGFYFSNQMACKKHFDTILNCPEFIDEKRKNAGLIFSERFLWSDILAQYEGLLLQHLKGNEGVEIINN